MGLPPRLRSSVVILMASNDLLLLEPLGLNISTLFLSWLIEIVEVSAVQSPVKT